MELGGLSGVSGWERGCERLASQPHSRLVCVGGQSGVELAGEKGYRLIRVVGLIGGGAGCREGL